jgi:hypothetical protein
MDSILDQEFENIQQKSKILSSIGNIVDVQNGSDIPVGSAAPASRLISLAALARGCRLLPWLYRLDEGRALAAVDAPSADIPHLVRGYQWPHEAIGAVETIITDANGAALCKPHGLCLSHDGNLVLVCTMRTRC